MSSPSEARKHLADAHRIVVKVGTHVVMHDGVELALGRIMEIVEGLARLRKAGREIVLVSSGAVGMGMRVLGLKDRPRSLGNRQACAAVGQGHLMSLYTDAFARFDVIAAQVLLTQEDLADRDRALNLRTTLMRLLELGAIPVLNENDSVSIAELVEHRRTQSGGADAPPAGFGDNDGLSARVAVSLDADLLVLLTNVGGLYTANPRVDPTATRIPELAGVDDAARARADGSSAGGTGGMASKLEAARLASAEGTAVLIAGGGETRVIERALAGEDLGTLIAVGSRRPARIRHIAVGARQRGALVVNDGALRALTAKKASLLPIGVVGVEGTFDKGDVVEIRDGSGRVHGRGLVNYAADACRKLAGRHSEEIDAILGWRGYDAVITRDNLVMGAV
ncbi:MAG TPA: glutamate 5-kinase [Polyangia bacterium]|nr:glutamate 5-kinase [Polyangia bacterium]